MSDAPALTITPVLSPSFDRARRLSRLLLVLFSILFWLTLALLVAIPGMALWPHAGSIKLSGPAISLVGLSGIQRAEAALILALSLLPALFLLHHTRRVFGSFSQGEVFAPKPIAHMRATGIWLIASFFVTIATHLLLTALKISPPAQIDAQGWQLLAGIATTVAAHVMAEAQRIADENASIL